ncbi:MAG: methylcobalamin:coenzyme M methyltransferase [candidate division TA06 bacterium ADurb.Bin417]|uniref:Methylcobalamin:coenzyme M methyltransferase n=1 Tax=candidate division TA06 bacterium ADurb.Bin417 TaxID=1852828 RepID=A0A1V5MFG8_UNCT6|nr:MAG: methylcobalamin:coenzyme M methyltransferase [candidate division TA06 bacterium ADurb.Bin417]
MLRVPLEKPKPDIENFIRTVRGQARPDRPPLVELFLDPEVIRNISTNYLGRRWPEKVETEAEKEALWRLWLEVYWRMGYDFVRVTGGLAFSRKLRRTEDTAGLSRGTRGWAEEGVGMITSWEDFERYEWPDPAKADLWNYEFVASILPEGMGLLVCPTSGFLEVTLDHLFGYQNLALMLYDQPDLVAAVFQKVGETICGLYERLLGLPGLRGFFQGDDMGFKTGTMIAPADLRRYVFPWHKRLADLAHRHGLVYLLHSCGRLEAVMEDLIEGVKIDGRHSFEDEGNPMAEFKRKYGERTAVLGGVDLDKLCRLEEAPLRAYVRKIIETGRPGGRFCLGSGNSVANYVPLRNYFAMVEEGLNFASR